MKSQTELTDGVGSSSLPAPPPNNAPVSDAPPHEFESERLAELLDKAELLERDKRKQEELERLGRLASFD